MTVNNKVNGASRKPVKLVGAAVLIAAVVLVVVWLKVVRGSEDPASAMATFVAKRGPLVISVLESGAIKAKEQEVIRNEVEGRTTIVWIIPEGTRVSKGDLLLELDVSTMTDLRIDQQIKVQNADAAYINAQETLAITENQAKSDIELSELTRKFAQQDLTQYLEGQYPNLEIAAVNKVQEANEVLTRAKETLRWSETLYAEKYISETELLADRLSKTRSENSLTVAQNDLRLLQEFTKQREMDQLTSDVNQAEMALERTRRKAAANMAQAKAELSAKELEFGQQKVKLAKIEDQLGKAKRYATADGMVVYATSSRGGFGRDDRRPLADGVEVYERQELIYIPKSASSVAEVDVHEASLDKVRAGLPAVVTVDAIPGKKFVGTVARIAPLPNAQSMWMNPDLKVYTTNINLETNDPALRSGMSCKAEIVVEQYQDVVYVPVQAVLRVGGQPTVFVVRDGAVEERKVEIGLDNNSMVVIRSGLSEGEVVLLTPPLKAATIGAGERVGGVADSNDPMAQRINEKLKEANEGLPAEGLGGPPLQQPGRQMGPGGPDAGEAGPRRRGPDGFQMPSDGEMQQMRQRFQNMTEEERQQEMEKMKRRFENMSEEEREQMRQRFGGRGRREGGRSGEGQGPGPRDGQGQGPERNP